MRDSGFARTAGVGNTFDHFQRVGAIQFLEQKSPEHGLSDHSSADFAIIAAAHRHRIGKSLQHGGVERRAAAEKRGVKRDFGRRQNVDRADRSEDIVNKPAVGIIEFRTVTERRHTFPGGEVHIGETFGPTIRKSGERYADDTCDDQRPLASDCFVVVLQHLQGIWWFGPKEDHLRSSQHLRSRGTELKGWHFSRDGLALRTAAIKGAEAASVS